MAEKETAQWKWERSPEYRHLFANYFKFRFSIADGGITFSQQAEPIASTNEPANTVIDQVTVSMSWPTLKMLGEYLATAVQEMEREVGPIATVGLSKEELQKQALAIIKGFGLRKK